MATKKATGTKGTQKKATTAPRQRGAKGRRLKGALSKAPAVARGTNAKSKAQVAEAARPARDPRLPEAGTILRKLDRHGSVRCECTVEANGVRYKGHVYRSISAAAVAAAKDLGINGAQNGYIFFGLSRPARAGEDPLTRLQKSWARYEACARSVVATATADRKPEVLAAIEQFRQVEIAAAG
jgi:Protein of unknown function (DUF2924)